MVLLHRVHVQCHDTTAGQAPAQWDRKEQGDRPSYKDRQRSSIGDRDGMKRPQANASAAFQKHRHCGRQADEATVARHQPERRNMRQKSEPEDKVPAPAHSTPSGSHMGADAPEKRSAPEPAASAGTANLSAAAQLKARLRGLPIPDAAVASAAPTVCLPTCVGSIHQFRVVLVKQVNPTPVQCALVRSRRLTYALD